MRIILPLTLAVALFSSCSVKQSEYDNLKKEVCTLKAQIQQDSVRISNLVDTIAILQYPANQRLASINKLVSNDDFSRAKQEIDELNKLFPESPESKQTPSILEKIENRIEKKKAEEEKLKAMGFKALSAKTSVVINYNKISFSGLSVSNEFVHDSYDDRWFYNRADRGNVYILATMSVTSESHDPDIPTLAVYSIKGDKMSLESIMRIEFARWKDYGAYLGNHADYGNDFSKTSTIRFKLGAEVSSEFTKKAYAIVLKKYNGLSRNYNRYDNPPISYRGNMMYPQYLSVDDFKLKGDNADYILVKIANL